MNEEIKKSIQKAGLFQYQIADALGVTEWTFLRWLRKELPEEKKKAVYAAIATLSRKEESAC